MNFPVFPSQAAPSLPQLQALLSSRLVLSPQELAYYPSLFLIVDLEGRGEVGGGEAAVFLKKSGLSRDMLHDIWSIADHKNEGKLDEEGFYTALRLVAHAQGGASFLSPELIQMEPPTLPFFEGIDPALPSPSPKSQGGARTAPSPTSSAVSGTPRSQGSGISGLSAPSTISLGPGTDRTWRISSRLREKYTEAFSKFFEEKGGKKAITPQACKKVFGRSGLSRAELAEIWELSDRDQDGLLSFGEFLVAMHLVSRVRSGYRLPSRVPAVLAAVLKEEPEGAGRKVAEGKEGHTIEDRLKDFPKAEREERSPPAAPASFRSVPNSGGFGSPPPLVTPRATPSPPPQAPLSNFDRFERENLRKLIARKRDYEQQVSILRARLDSARDKKDRLSKQDLELDRDLSILQEGILASRSQIEANVVEVSEVKEAYTRLFKGVGGRGEREEEGGKEDQGSLLKKEKEMLAREEQEVLELRSQHNRLCREKEDCQARQLVLNERVKQAEMDRALLLSSLETERSKLTEIRGERLRLLEEKQQLTRELTNLGLQQLGASTLPSSKKIPVEVDRKGLRNERHSGAPWVQFEKPKGGKVLHSSSAAPLSAQNLSPFESNRGQRDDPSEASFAFSAAPQVPSAWRDFSGGFGSTKNLFDESKVKDFQTRAILTSGESNLERYGGFGLASSSALKKEEGGQPRGEKENMERANRDQGWGETWDSPSKARGEKQDGFFSPTFGNR